MEFPLIEGVATSWVMDQVACGPSGLQLEQTAYAVGSKAAPVHPFSLCRFEKRLTLGDGPGFAGDAAAGEVGADAGAGETAVPPQLSRRSEADAISDASALFLAKRWRPVNIFPTMTPNCGTREVTKEQVISPHLYQGWAANLISLGMPSQE